MDELMQEYRKYRWFFTSNGKLVIGGKSAEQNDSLLKFITSQKDELIVMHTNDPGSPFCVVLSLKKSVKKTDIEECAIFTGCFSRAWKEGKKETDVDIFSSKDVYKMKGMKTGTWGVKKVIKKIKVKLELALAIQENVLRAVPKKSVKNGILTITPGNIPKEKAREALIKEGHEFKNEDLLSALPSGGFTL